jgi:hypothetical protein
MEFKQLGAAVVLAKLFVLELSVIRTMEELFHGRITVEGMLALAVACILAISLGRGALRSGRGRTSIQRHDGRARNF